MMKKFVWAVIVVAGIEAAAIALVVDTILKFNAGTGTLSVKMILLVVCAIALPPIVLVGLRARFRAESVRKAALARFVPLLPEHVVFAAYSTPGFVAAINRVHRVSGYEPIVSNKMPLIVSISKRFMSIDMTGKTSRRGSALTLMTSMITSVSAESISQPMPGTRGSVTMQVLHLTIADGQLDLNIPVQTDGLGQTTRAEVEAIAVRVAEKVRLGRTIQPAS